MTEREDPVPGSSSADSSEPSPASPEAGWMTGWKPEGLGWTSDGPTVAAAPAANDPPQSMPVPQALPAAEALPAPEPLPVQEAPPVAPDAGTAGDAGTWPAPVTPPAEAAPYPAFEPAPPPLLEPAPPPPFEPAAWHERSYAARPLPEPPAGETWTIGMGGVIALVVAVVIFFGVMSSGNWSSGNVPPPDVFWPADEQTQPADWLLVSPDPSAAEVFAIDWQQTTYKLGTVRGQSISNIKDAIARGDLADARFNLTALHGVNETYIGLLDTAGNLPPEADGLARALKEEQLAVEAIQSSTSIDDVRRQFDDLATVEADIASLESAIRELLGLPPMPDGQP